MVNADHNIPAFSSLRSSSETRVLVAFNYHHNANRIAFLPTGLNVRYPAKINSQESGTCSMARFEIGSRVKVVGPIAENYPRVTAIVSDLRRNETLPHLSRYRVLIAGGEDTFYEFQLAPFQDDPACKTRLGST